MRRQLYGLGSLVGREKFGLGSKLKKFVRKIIPNEVADIAVKAAPFVAPFNPLLAGGMSALGSFDQTGSIGQSVRSGLINYGLGQGARFLGGAQMQTGINPFAGDKLFTSPIGLERTGLGTFLQDKGYYAPGIEQVPVSPEKIPGPIEGVVKTSVQKTSPFQQSVQKVLSGDFTTMGEGLKELGGQGLKKVFTNPVRDASGKVIDYEIDKLAVGATIAGGASYLEAKKLAEEAELVTDEDEYTEEMYEADKARYTDYYSQILTPAAFGLKDGGRVALEGGGVPSIMLKENKDYNFMDLINKEDEDEYYEKKAEELDRKYNPERYKQILPKEKPMAKYMLDEVMSEKGMNTLSEETRDEAMKMYAEKAFKKGQISEDEYREIMGFKMGGRVKYKIGSKPEKRDEGIMSLDMETDKDKEDMLMADAPGITFTTAEKSFLFKTLGGQGGPELSFTMPQLYGILNNPNSDKNIGDAKALKAFLKLKGFKTGGRVQYAMGSEVPVRKNQGGITELDYRNTGGFVPIGVKEKADDVPAMLSKNEFVFTADAVRAAGGGSINKGAQRMYNLMKSLENKVV